MRKALDPSHKHLQVTIGGFPTDQLTRAELAELMVTDSMAARERRRAGMALPPKLVICSNGQGISMAGTDPEFARAMENADIVHADGMPLVFASRLLTRVPLPERIATTDFVHDAAKVAARTGVSFYMLGGTEEQNANACRQLQTLYPDLRIAGRSNGYDGLADPDLCRKIVDSGADVLWVALGKPRQEFWCVENRERLRGVAWIKTCGGLYAFLASEVPRAPQWMQDAGFEWVFRLMQEPRRLLQRYLITNPHSIYRMIRYSG